MSEFPPMECCVCRREIYHSGGPSGTEADYCCVCGEPVCNNCWDFADDVSDDVVCNNCYKEKD
jgi:hypothetical protein